MAGLPMRQSLRSYDGRHHSAVDCSGASLPVKRRVFQATVSGVIIRDGRIT